MTDIQELEIKLKLLEEKVDELVTTVKDFRETAERDRKEIKQLVSTIREEIAHYKGIAGGGFFVLTGLGTLLIAFKDNIMRLFGNGN